MAAAGKWLQELSQKLELPADILAGVPRMELIGSELFTMEPHKGLLEYERTKICISSAIGVVQVHGSGLGIKLMNYTQITISGKICRVSVGEAINE